MRKLKWVIFCALLFTLNLTNAAIPSDSVLPAKKLIIHGGNELYLLDGIEKFRGVILKDGNTGWNHTWSVLSHIWDFAFIDIVNDADPGQLLKDAAEKSGHPELANAPLVWSVDRWNSQMENFTDAHPERVIAYDGGFSLASNGGKNTPRIKGQYECREQATVRELDEIHKNLRSQDLPVTYYPVWGWPRGTHSGWDLVYPFFDWAIRTRLPDGPVPEDGKVQLKDLSLQQGWLGDPNTWYGWWPQVYKYDEFPGDKSLAPWLPNSYLAHVWKALVSRDSTKTQSQAGVWGEIFHSDHAGQSHGCSAQPPLGITAPVRHYGKKNGGTNQIMVPLVSTVEFTVKVDIPNIKEIRVYDGDKLIEKLQPNIFKIYKVDYKLEWTGVHSLIVQVTTNSGEEVSSRPANIFVGKGRLPSTSLNKNPRESITVFKTGLVSRSSGVVALPVTVQNEGIYTAQLRSITGKTVSNPESFNLNAGENHMQLKAIPNPGLYLLLIKGNGETLQQLVSIN